jgi:hypothetical protein
MIWRAPPFIQSNAQIKSLLQQSVDALLPLLIVTIVLLLLSHCDSTYKLTFDHCVWK